MTKPEYLNIITNSKWISKASVCALDVPEQWHKWLFDQGSLTKMLRSFSNNNFSVRVLSERWGKPLPREALKLGCEPYLVARIREVELLCNGEVMVFARSIIPLKVFAREPNTFMKMGSKPLGHLLFSDGGIRRSKRDISVLQLSHRQKLFGRATPYRYHGGEILVSEFFVNPALVTD